MNVNAGSLSLRAGGTIGTADVQGPPRQELVNRQAIDTTVTRVSAESAHGIYLQEFAAGGGLTVDNVLALTVDLEVTRADFDSDTSQVTASATLGPLSDLTTTVAGAIKVVTDNGTLTVNQGERTTRACRPLVVATCCWKPVRRRPGRRPTWCSTRTWSSVTGNVSLVAADRTCWWAAWRLRT